MPYLDHAATTHVRPAARAALVAALDGAPGNASASHAAGQASRAVVEEARERLAGLLGASPHDVVLTAGGTEADNLGIVGLAWGARQAAGRTHLLVSAVEHPAVLAPARWLAAEAGFSLDVVPVDRAGRVAPESVVERLRPDTALVSVMLANNELGTVQDVPAIVAAVREADPDVVVHTDAVQALATRPVELGALGVDALSLSGHKVGAPTGVGALVVRRGVPIQPVLHGGGQERGVRSGTFAHPLVAALAAAVEEAVADRARLVASASRWDARLRAAATGLEGVRPTLDDDVARLPTHTHLSVDGVDGAELLFALDRADLSAAGGAACHAGAVGGSPVLAACGIEADATLRLSTGWTTTDADVERAVDLLADVIASLRSGRSVVDAVEADA